MKNKLLILLHISFLVPFLGTSQTNTFSPYSRYGLGEIAPTTLAHNAGMGGTYIAMRPDSTMPLFINTGNPAAYAFIRLTSLEVGGNFLYSKFSSNDASLKKWTTNFSYGALGFPIGRNGGAAFGLMPYSNIGFDAQNTINEPGIGDVLYTYSGTGSLNKAFLGYGVLPFDKRLSKFRNKHLYIPDSLKKLSHATFKILELGNKLINDFSIGANANYIFGNVNNVTGVLYPNSQIYNNTFRARELTLGDFTANFGAQTAITIDSVRIGRKHRRALKEKVKFTFGYFMGLNNSLKATYSSLAQNYYVDSYSQITSRDTVLYTLNEKGTIKLPLEQGFGIGLKKGERLNLVADYAITNWQNFRYLNTTNDLKNNYRMSVGLNFVPEKYAAGNNAFFKRVNYRLGASYQTGYIDIKNTLLSNYAITAGVGLPVGIGRLSSMVNISAQYGQMGTKANGLTKENYWRINFGFTFSDRWFQKFRYD